MSENPTPDEKEFAKQIDDEIKARFHFELKSRLKEETLEEVQDAYKLVMPATDSKGFKDAACHFSTKSDVVTTMGDDALEIWARDLADIVIERLISFLRKPEKRTLQKSENTILLMMTQLAFSAVYDDHSASFWVHISFRYGISEIKTKEVRDSLKWT